MWMRSQNVVRIFSVTALASMFITATAILPNHVRAVGPNLPEGSMKAKAVTECMECHDAHIIVQQRMSKAAWVKEVEKMTRWGATVAPEDKDALVDYFSSNLPVDAPAYEPAETAKVSKSPVKKK